jgi:hypothetical protein
MSDERWIPMAPAERHAAYVVNHEPLDSMIAKYDAAKGQRAETIRWCETHGERAHPLMFKDGETCWPGDDAPEDCTCVDAMLILPPRSSS